MLEKDLSKSIQERLSIYHLTKQVEWWGRLNSLHVRTIMGSYVKGCPKGTPDFLVLVRNPNNGITVLFLELKSTTGKLRKEQIEFRDLYSEKKDFWVLEVRRPVELDIWIDKNSYDYVKDI